MFIKQVLFATHATVLGVFHAGKVYEVTDEKGEALLELASEAGDQIYVEASEGEHAVSVAEEVKEEAPAKPPKKINIGGKNKAAADTAKPSGDDTPVIV